MAATLTTEEIARFLSQQHELSKRVLRGTLSLAQVRPALQAIIDGEFATGKPSNKQACILDLHPHFNPQLAIDRMKSLNKSRGKKYGWQFSAADFKNLPEPPAWPTEARLPAIVLCTNLDTVGNTFNEACIAAKSRQPKQWEHNLDLEKITLRYAEFEPHTLWWEAVDLAANWNPAEGRRVSVLTDPSLAHVQCLWAADQFPESWVQVQIGRADGVPFVDMAGYRYSGSFVPCLDWNAESRGLFVIYYGDGNLRRFYSAPLALRD